MLFKMERRVKLEIDTREKCPDLEQLVANMAKSAIVVREPLEVADFIIYVNDQPALLIERKTPEDLMDSIMDGRYHSQKQRMIDCAKEKGARVMYLLDGIPKLKHGSPILGAIVNTIVRDGICVTCVPVNSLQLVLAKMVVCAIEHGVDVKWIPTLANETESITRAYNRSRVIVPGTYLLTALTSVPNIGEKTATAVAAEYRSMAALVAAYEQCPEKDRKLMLANIKVGSKKLGKIKSTRIYNFIYGAG